MTYLAVFVIWRQVDLMVIGDDNLWDNVSNSTITGIQKTYYIIEVSFCCSSGFFLSLYIMFMFMITPVIYQDLKDYTIIMLKSNHGLWRNFFKMTRSQSIIVLDIFMNLQFWISIGFVMFNSRPDSSNPTTPEWLKFYAAVAIDIFLLIFVLVGDCIGFRSINRVNEAQIYECWYFSIRLIGECCKIFITVMYCWLQKNIFFEDLIQK